MTSYSHQALFHDTDEELLAALVPFVTDGIDAGEYVLVVVNRPVGDMLRERLGSIEGFDLLDSADVYGSPARTLASYAETIRDHTSNGRRMRASGEPIWRGRSQLEIEEWTCFEAACNVVFADVPVQILCPYDMSRLDPAVIDAARRTHPEIRRGSTIRASPDFSPLEHHLRIRSGAFPSRPESCEQISVFSKADCATVVAFVESFGRSHAMADARLADFKVAVGELLTNAIEYRAGPAWLRVWTTGPDLICEIEGRGSFASAFAELIPPSTSGAQGAGLWLAGQKCDLIAVRGPVGNTTVRLHFSDHVVAHRRDCGGIDELLGAYALGACHPEEVVLIEAHLTTCAECRAEAERFAQVVTSMDDPDRPHGRQ